ncbi:MAG: hypothetical protein JW836_05630 [Deltaproteobacteria bacterium]|nr:hypothetical protein [Deltaproteobacteria bacterium]
MPQPSQNEINDHRFALKNKDNRNGIKLITPRILGIFLENTDGNAFTPKTIDIESQKMIKHPWDRPEEVRDFLLDEVRASKL